MTRRNSLLVIGGLVLLGQIVWFQDYILPFQWGQLKVSGLACTCPDETVVNGGLYLRAITPDSLKNYDLDFSEIYVTEKPSTNLDPMGADLYIIKGHVIGKDRLTKEEDWNLKFKVESWREVDILKDWCVKGLFFIQLALLLLVAFRTASVKK